MIRSFWRHLAKEMTRICYNSFKVCRELIYYLIRNLFTLSEPAEAVSGKYYSYMELLRTISSSQKKLHSNQQYQACLPS